MEKTFNILVQQFRPMILCYLRTLSGDRHMAEDLAQETFLAAHESIDNFDLDANFGAWLRGIARHKFLQHRRSALRRKLLVDSRVVDGIEEVYAVFDQPGASASDWDDRLRLLGLCISQLSERLREAVDITYARGKQLSQAAAEIGSTPAAVGQRLTRARRLLRECMERRLGEPNSDRANHG